MDSLLLTCSPDISKLISHNNNRYRFQPSQKPFLTVNLRTQLIITASAKRDNKNKIDKHSFVPKQDESSGLFPEAVLLKEKKVQEDGKLLPEFADDEEQELFQALTLQLESDLDVDTMRHYEVVYLIHEDHKQEVESINEKVQGFIKEKKGRLWRFSDWGMRRLAYKIQKARNAHYILMNFEVEAKWINDFKTMLDQDERVIRHLVIKKDKAETEECPPPPPFNSMDMDDNEDFEDEYDYDDDDEEEINEDEADGIIYVDEDEDEVKGSKGKRKQKMEVAR